MSNDATRLNSTLTFDSFVVGEGNRAAHTAAVAVVQHPSELYNPVLVCSSVGLGKTHLLHAIGNAFKTAYPDKRVIYRTAEDFVNGAKLAFRGDRIADFQRRSRAIDVLLVDDVHFLERTQHIQEAFFELVCSLTSTKKQVIVSSSRPPRALRQIRSHLRDRLSSGLVVEICSLELELKLSILQAKSELKQISLPETVALYIAERASTVRELEGALNSLINQSLVTREVPTVEMARSVLEGLLGDTHPTIAEIEHVVSEAFRISPRLLRAKNNSHEAVLPRQIAMYLAQRLTNSSSSEIARHFKKDHSTVIHSVKKMTAARESDRELNGIVESLEDALKYG